MSRLSAGPALLTLLCWLWTMWAVMMVGMMLPSAFPVLLFYDSVLRRVPDPQPQPKSQLQYS